MKTPASPAYTAKKIIALLLVAASLAMLFLPWFGISIRVLGRDYSIPDLLDVIDDFGGYSREDIRDELYDTMEDVAESLSDIRVHYSAHKLIKMVEPLEDGRLSPVELGTVTMKVGTLLKKMESALRSEDDYFSSAAAEQIAPYGGKLIAASVVVWALILGALVFAVLTLAGYNRIGKKTLIGYVCFIAVLVLLFVALTVGGNAAVRNLGDTVTDLLDELFDLSYAMGAFSIRKLFRLGLWSVLSLMFAVGALVLRLTSSVASASAPARGGKKRPGASGWVCPACGATQGEEFAFCYQCGSKRPASNRCLGCGNTLPEGALFCPICGRKNDTEAAPERPPRFCPACGAKNPGDSPACARCGYSFGGSHFMGDLIQ
mgnify:CR=1 FL=1